MDTKRSGLCETQVAANYVEAESEYDKDVPYRVIPLDVISNVEYNTNAIRQSATK